MAMWYRVHSKYLQEVNLVWKRKSDGREQEVADKLGHSLRLVIDNLFLKGEPVNRVNFLEICHFLGLDWREIAGLAEPESQVSTPVVEVTSEEDAVVLSRPTGGVDDVDKAINDLVGTLCEMLRRLTRNAGDLLRADRTSIFLLDHQTKVLGTIVAEDGEGGCLLIDLPMDKGFASLAASSLKVINVPFDVYDDPLSEEAKRIDRKTGYRTYSILAWPLLNTQRDLVAVVQLINKLKPNSNPADNLAQRIDRNGFNREDEEKFAKFAPSILKLLEKCQLCYELAKKVRKNAIITHGSAVIQNAALIAELRRQEQQLRKSLDKMSVNRQTNSSSKSCDLFT